MHLYHYSDFFIIINMTDYSFQSVKQLKLDGAASASGTQRKTRNCCQTYLCLAVTCQEHVKILEEFPLSKMLQETVALSRVPSKFSKLSVAFREGHCCYLCPELNPWQTRPKF